jgi:adenylate kinase family enzyme
VISSFIQKLRDDDENRVIIEDFPLKQEYYNLFVRNGKAFRRLFYLNCEDNNCTIRMKEMGKDNRNYVGCAQLKNENAQFDSKRELLEMYRKKGNMIEINANNPLELVFQDILNAIKPEIYMFSSDNESTNLKNDLVNYFENNLNFEVVNVIIC